MPEGLLSAHRPERASVVGVARLAVARGGLTASKTTTAISF